MIITRAAIMFPNGEILEGQTYSSITITANKLGLTGDKVYGFMTSEDVFVDSGFAAFIALEAGQIKQEKEKLETEDLWPHLTED